MLPTARLKHTYAVFGTKILCMLHSCDPTNGTYLVLAERSRQLKNHRPITFDSVTSFRLCDLQEKRAGFC